MSLFKFLIKPIAVVVSVLAAVPAQAQVFDVSEGLHDGRNGISENAAHATPANIVQNKKDLVKVFAGKATPTFGQFLSDADIARAQAVQQERQAIERAIEQEWLDELAGIQALTYADIMTMIADARPGKEQLWHNRHCMSGDQMSALYPEEVRKLHPSARTITETAMAVDPKVVPFNFNKSRAWNKALYEHSLKILAAGPVEEPAPAKLSERNGAIVGTDDEGLDYTHIHGNDNGSISPYARLLETGHIAANQHGTTRMPNIGTGSYQVEDSTGKFFTANYGSNAVNDNARASEVVVNKARRSTSMSAFEVAARTTTSLASKSWKRSAGQGPNRHQRRKAAKLALKAA